MGSSEAVQCLKLAESYVIEASDAIPSIEGDQSVARGLLNTLELAMKQVEKAEEIDPSANVDGRNISFIKAGALGYRGVIENIGLDNRASAISNLQKSIALRDDISEFHYAIGMIYGQTGKKEDALRHLNRAIELNPDNIEYRKSLDRIDNVSDLGMKVGAFRGSWKVILVLGGLSVLGLVLAMSRDPNTTTPGIFNFIFWGVIAFIYWKLKSR